MGPGISRGGRLRGNWRIYRQRKPGEQQNIFPYWSRNGKDWKDRFYKEVEEEYAREKTVIQILKEDAGYQDILKGSHPEPSYSIFRLTPITGTGQYDVHVCITSGTGEKSKGYVYRADYGSRSVRKH